MCPCGARTAPNATNIEKGGRGGGCPAGIGRRKNRGEVVENEEGDVTPIYF